ncbi:ATP-dependent helicase [Pseudoclavibacter chungangensis]|uniref:DNA 3'-5' helicase n=1 Tax=Pseudoclavibacter chungangensis TaxID=587635 RepID=A0A7J5BUC1_9MICO|nr:ATP-dependent helicase [Pseudoclavibacter chungangensis]KAB1657949.1 ATP-dependent helicase [Pseudoclavibacter chungangensis]NYJ65897.1 DNA helicase-2/ATP-dependent DNA helicase PcrA [Pseudoclavibacter chungangensis]
MFDIDWRSGLVEEQLAAAEHDARPLVVAAGAGTGKTRTLTARVARLVESGVAPERILLLTFTRRAAASMTTRAAALCGDPSIGARLWSGTFHAVAHRVVVEHAQHLGLLDVTVLDPGDVVDLVDLLREAHGLTGTGRRLPTSRTIADIGSRAVNTATPSREVMATHFPWALEFADEINALLRDYGARKRERGLVDFDDLLLTWRALLAHPDTGARIRARWDHVLVDEYQDVNSVQVDIVRLLRPGGDGLTVVGDDAQAVYGFRGADAGHLLALHDELPDATLVRLERSFRSTQAVLDLANVVRPGDLPIRLTAAREEQGARPRVVHCTNADDEAREVAEAVLTAHQDGTALREQAVLMRTGSHSDVLEIELRVRGIPFVKYGGIGYLDTAHVRDLLAAFRVTVNPADEISWFRLLTRHRAIGKATARTLAARLADIGTGWDERVEDLVAEAPPRARTALAATLGELALAGASDAVPEAVEACRRAVVPLLRAHYADWARRSDDIETLAGAAATQRDLRAFVADATLDPASASSEQASRPHLDEDYLVLSTIHSAKGLEWDAVHLLRAADGAMPSDMSLGTEDGLAEELRLFYVALTRARDELRVYVPARLPTHPTSLHARHVIAKPSRFLTPDALATVDEVHTDAVRSAERRPAAPRPVAAHVPLPSVDGLFT